MEDFVSQGWQLVNHCGSSGFCLVRINVSKAVLEDTACFTNLHSRKNVCVSYNLSLSV